MKSRALVMVLVSIVVASLVAIAGNRWISKRLNAAAEKGEMAQVVAAATDIPVGTKLDLSHVKAIEIAPGAVPEGSFSSPDKLLGSVVKQNIYAGEIVVQRRVEEDASGSRLAALISEGKRAITVRVDDVSGVSGFLLPGSRVDMIAVSRGQGAKTILQDLKILAVGQQINTGKDGAVSVRAVTLEVDPMQAEIIAKSGRVRLTLRNPGDTEHVEEPPPEVAVAEPAPEPEIKVEAEPEKPQRHTLFAVDVIRGTKVSTTTVEE